MGLLALLLLIVGIVLVLFVGNYLAYVGRAIPTEFNESKWTATAMVVNLQVMLLGVPVLILANDNPIAGFAVKCLIVLVSAGGTVGLIFIPKLLMAYNLYNQKDKTDAWKIVTSGSSGSSKVNNKNANNGNSLLSKGVIQPSRNEQTFDGAITLDNKEPSISSLLDAPKAPPGYLNERQQNRYRMNQTTTKSKSNEGNYSSQHNRAEQLSVIMESDPTRRRFRRYLATLKMDENVLFWDSVAAFIKELNDTKRSITARQIIMTYILDNSPKQVNVAWNTKNTLMEVYKSNDVKALSDLNLFEPVIKELFDDLKNSTAFLKFLDDGGATAMNLSLSGPSDISLS